ncbi:DoxX family protein [Ancylobacter sp. WKF20]|uniref:DoxX family protein n=1 Tax=Ancylobacter sp. WKF20 TaxID=3039801 RepID=UPI002434254E|nr:DoxX family protein [Ancylobacter sp. WKF20]WGD29744.1 DoxX family protein [Ancylobacter sp. WKF20]
MGSGYWVDLIGRLGIAFYFIWATWFNYTSWGHHISEFNRIGVGPAAPALVLGLIASFVGAVLLLIPGTVVYGAAILIVFTALADALFHRYWTYPDPHEQVIHKFFLFEHVALIGGLLAVIAPRLG